MSVINNEHDLESLLVDICTQDLNDLDIGRIADAIPDQLLAEAITRRPALFTKLVQMANQIDEQLSRR